MRLEPLRPVELSSAGILKKRHLVEVDSPRSGARSDTEEGAVLRIVFESMKPCMKRLGTVEVFPTLSMPFDCALQIESSKAFPSTCSEPRKTVPHWARTLLGVERTTW